MVVNTLNMLLNFLNPLNTVKFYQILNKVNLY